MPEDRWQTDVIIIGGGAAGLFCAATAAARGRKVVLLEHNERIGKKILISGGGRCNFTNLYASPDNYLSENPDFCRSALARYQPTDFIALVESHGIAYHEKKLGQQFCDTSSRQIVEMLISECDQAGAVIKTGCKVATVQKSDRFTVKTSLGTWQASSLVVATGGLSFPNLGASDFGYRLANQFGLERAESRPGLVPLTFGAEERSTWQDLSGLSLPVTLRYAETRFTENLLFTHRGLSGPAVLQISSYWKKGENLEIDLLPGLEVGRWMQSESRGGRTLEALLGTQWPQRFAHQWCATLERATKIDARRPMAQLSSSALKTVELWLKAWKVPLQETEGYSKAEVTCGGVSTTELSSKTLEARKVPGLYFIGEVVDVTGWLGGYNFQWAWASGHAAGNVV